MNIEKDDIVKKIADQMDYIVHNRMHYLESPIAHIILPVIISTDDTNKKEFKNLKKNN